MGSAQPGATASQSAPAKFPLWENPSRKGPSAIEGGLISDLSIQQHLFPSDDNCTSGHPDILTDEKSSRESVPLNTRLREKFPLSLTVFSFRLAGMKMHPTPHTAFYNQRGRPLALGP